MSILEMLSSDNYIVVNKSLIRAIGLEAAVLLGNLASEYTYWEERGELIDGFFFSTIDNIEEKTGLSSYQQRQAINKLLSLGMIETKKMGIPAKRYIRISERQVVGVLNDKLLKNCTTGGEKIKQQQVKKLHSNNIINNKNIEQEYKGNTNIGKKPFVKPTVDEITAYCIERKNNVDPQKFYDYYTSNGWKVGRNPMKDWKACVRTWEKSRYDQPRQKAPKPQEGTVNEFDEILKAEGYI